MISSNSKKLLFRFFPDFFSTPILGKWTRIGAESELSEKIRKTGFSRREISCIDGNKTLVELYLGQKRTDFWPAIYNEKSPLLEDPKS